jgi:flagellar assembly protein FliH
MSDAAVMPVTLTNAMQRSAFKPMRALTPVSADAGTRIDNYARGLADGQKLAQTAFAAEHAALQRLLAASQALQPDAGPELSLLLRETVFRLVKQMSDRITIDACFLDAQIAQATAIITEADGARRILLHPEDAALVGDHIHSLPVRSDQGLARGMIRIECSQGWVDHGIALGLERLRDLLGVAA